MYKFLFKSTFFILPFIILYIWNVCMYDVNGNDLIRLGYIPDFYLNTKRKLFESNELKKYYDDFYHDKLKDEYDILVFGDSFSEGNASFTNKIAKHKKVLQIDASEVYNPIQRLVCLINSDFFEKIKVKNIILESVERSVIERSIELNFKKNFFKCNFNVKISNTKPIHRFFSSQSLLFGYNSLKFLLKSNAKFNESVLMFGLNRTFFTHLKSRTLLTLADDVNFLKLNNSKSNSLKLNNQLNFIHEKLLERNSRLFFLVCPDKYDLYYDYINHRNLVKPVFFDHLISCNKKYYFINSKRILSKELKKGNKDLYFYDDTHWSSKSVKIISDSILKIL